MKLTPVQMNILRGIISERVNSEMETIMENVMDNYFRDRVVDDLSDEDFTEEEKDQVREDWNNDKEGGMNVEIWMDFCDDVTRFMMTKFEE